MRKGWKKVRLGDVIILNYGKALTSINRKVGTIPVYSSAGITGFHNDPLVDSDGIIIGRKGSVGTVYYSPCPFFCIDTAYYILPSRNYDLKYIYYRLRSLGLENLNEDSAVPGLNRDTAYNQLFLIPPLSEQRTIALILSALDDKITLNTKLNHHLEQMAQAIFKSWFVDFEPFSDGDFVDSELGEIPVGWRVGILDECIDFFNGYAFKSNELLDSEEDDCYHVFKMGHIKKGGGFNADGTKSWINRKNCQHLEKYLLRYGDILMCMTDMKGNVALLGHTALMGENNKYVVNQRVGLLRINNAFGIDYPFLYTLTNYKDFIENLRGRANSGVQVNLSTTEIKASKFPLAPKKINERFNKATKPLFRAILNNQRESAHLATLRDTLLPRLMSGELSTSK